MADTRPRSQLDPRTTTNPVVRAVGRWLGRVNDLRPWNHNDHFHGWIVRRLPLRRRRALDVGCGTGTLVHRLRRAGATVVGLDADAAMSEVSAARFAGDPGVSVRHGRFEDVPADGSFDVVTMVASLHHMDLEAALRHAAGVLAPGGRLLAVGLARIGAPRDLAVDLCSSFLNPVVGLVKHPRPVTVPDDGPPMPVRDARETYGEVRETARRVLPGARFRQRLFFRYTLEWTAPAS
ncbi:class I SAM-dependent methyltransferase [Isoptericola sp. 4D.3]|uniref:Class I SAM-dependent methyltransferase n=1 Tax=Isoptericola peretonis TaxID=2918523 RepID=A0ABT0J8P5_9MICO|nr:class I SAM-dependent methyltransferase [Isoptericola sp. 4D.3]